MKKILKLALCALLALTTVFAFAACTDKDVSEEEVKTLSLSNVEYAIVTQKNKEGKVIDTYAKIIGYDGQEQNLIIPQTVDDNIPVKAIANLAFYDNKTIKSVVLPEGLTTVGAFSFGYMDSLIRVELPSTVIEIGEYAFINCTALKEVRIAAVKRPKLGEAAFKFYNSKDKQYQISPYLEIKVPDIDAYSTTDVHDKWIEYGRFLKEA